MRDYLVVAAVTAGVMGICGTVPPGSGDLQDMGGVADQPVSVDGTVLGASRQGRVLVTEGERVCLYELDGSLGECFDMAIAPGEPVAFSPSGTKIAVGNARLVTINPDADPGLSVLDVESGEVTVLGAELFPADVFSFDAFPAWRSEEVVDYLHHDLNAGQTSHVTASLDGTGEAMPVKFSALAVGSVGIVGDELIAVLQDRDGSRVVAVGSEATPLLELDGDRGAVGGVSADGRIGVVVAASIVTLRTGPVAVLTAGVDEPAISTFDAISATVDPIGSLVAAAVPTDPNVFDADVELLVWDHVANESAVLDVEVELPISMVWTDDDQLVLLTVASWSVVQIER